MMELGTFVRTLDYRYVMALEWIGSILMMATVWGWIYKKIYPTISENLATSRRHYLAIDRFMRIKAKEALPKLEEFEKDRADIGITSMTPFYTRLRLIIEAQRIRNRLRQHGLMPEEKEKKILRRQENIGYLMRLFIAYYANKSFAEVKLFVMRIIHAVTVHVFAGKLRVIIFLTGFVLWNLSKGLAIYMRTLAAKGILP